MSIASSVMFIRLSELLLLLLLLIRLLQVAAASRRILLMPFPYKSHVAEIGAIGSELLTSGRAHSVHVLLPESYPELDGVAAATGFDVVRYTVTQRDFYSMPPADGDWVDVALNSYPLDEFRSNVDGFVQLCTNPLTDPALADRLRRLRFDLALVDAFPGSRCYWILAHRIGVPYASLATQYEPWLWRVPALPSFVPFPLGRGAYTERMTFVERLRNALSLLDWTVWPRVDYVDDAFVEKYLPGQTYWSLAGKSLVWLVDTDTIIDYPRPTMPNEVRTS